MTTAQKIIKYLAMGFAAFLIVTIFSAILGGGYALLSALGLIHSNKNIVTEDLKVISDEVTEVSTLNVELAFANLEIKTGDNFKVETNNTKISFKNDNGSIIIKEDDNWKINGGESLLVIYLPEDMMDLDETKIETGAGKLNIQTLNTQGLYLELGAGDVQIENLVVTQEAKIDGGVGKTEIKSCEINDLEANLGMGEFIFNGKLTGKSEIDSGIGSININLSDEGENYTIKPSKGIGSIQIDGKEIADGEVWGNGENRIEIDGGIGNIKINFENEI